MVGNLGSFVSGLVGEYIIGPIKSLFGIHSPSRVFMAIGNYTVKGLSQGRISSERTAIFARNGRK